MGWLRNIFYELNTIIYKHVRADASEKRNIFIYPYLLTAIVVVGFAKTFGRFINSNEGYSLPPLGLHKLAFRIIYVLSINQSIMVNN